MGIRELSAADLVVRRRAVVASLEGKDLRGCLEETGFALITTTPSNISLVGAATSLPLPFPSLASVADVLFLLMFLPGTQRPHQSQTFVSEIST